MLAHHQALEDGVRERTDALARAGAAGHPFEPAAAELVAYLADEVLPHAQAEEQTIYRAAGDLAELADTVAEMISEHRTLASAGRRAGLGVRQYRRGYEGRGDRVVVQRARGQGERSPAAGVGC
jgi:hypothetical protein